MSTRSKRAAERRSARSDVKRADAPSSGLRPLPGRKPLSNRARMVSLVLGDILVFLVFATIGLKSHGLLITSVLTVLWVALPFALAWLLIAPLLGVYKRGLELDPKAMARRTIIAWIVVWPFSMILRGILVDHQVPPPIFWVVALISIAIIMLVWRVPFAITHQANQRGR